MNCVQSPELTYMVERVNSKLSYDLDTLCEMLIPPLLPLTHKIRNYPNSVFKEVSQSSPHLCALRGKYV